MLLWWPQPSIKMPAWESSTLPGKFAICSSQHLMIGLWPSFLFLEHLLKRARDCDYVSQHRRIFLKDLRATPLNWNRQEGQWLWEDRILTSIMPTSRYSWPNHIYIDQSLVIFVLDSPEPLSSPLLHSLLNTRISSAQIRMNLSGGFLFVSLFVFCFLPTFEAFLGFKLSVVTE